MTKWLQLAGAGLVLLAVVVAAVALKSYRQAHEVVRLYVPPKGMEIVKGSGPLGCDFSGIDSPIITGVMPRVREPSVKLQLPKAYLMRQVADGALGTEGTLLMQMKADNFVPYPSHEQHLTQASARHQSLAVLIWQFGPLKNIAQSDAEFDAGTKPGTKFKEVQQANGLLRYQFVPLQNKEIYVARAAGEITDVIECYVNTGGQMDVPSPNCDHMTTAAGLDVSITYYKTRLDDWKVIKERVTKFLTCMIID